MNILNTGFHPALSNPFTSASSNGLLTNLILALELNEASSIDAIDASGVNTDFTNNSSVGVTTGLVYSNARSFNGSTQYFNHASNSNLQISSSMTFEIWVRFTNIGGNLYNWLIGKDNISVAREYDILYNHFDTQRIAFQVFSTGTSYSVTANTFGQPVNNVWTHILARYDIVNGVIGIRVNNGTEDILTGVPGLDTTSADLIIGGVLANSSPLPAAFHQGQLGPIRIWKGLLTTTQDAFLFNSGFGRPFSIFN